MKKVYDMREFKMRVGLLASCAYRVESCDTEDENRERCRFSGNFKTFPLPTTLLLSIISER